MSSERKGDYIQTFTGKHFYPLDPRPEDFDIQDIAHSLAMQCRFNGHSSLFYSVAEHSVHIARYVRPRMRKAALLHDASEAYLCDIPRPLKPMLRGYAEIEADILRMIGARFGVSEFEFASVKDIDARILNDEAEQLMGTPEWRNKWGKPLDIDLPCWPWEDAEKMFLAEWAKA